MLYLQTFTSRAGRTQSRRCRLAGRIQLGVSPLAPRHTQASSSLLEFALAVFVDPTSSWEKTAAARAVAGSGFKFKFSGYRDSEPESA
jgi:hypothetical protein